MLAARRAPLGILVVAIAGWCVVMGSLIVLRHERFGTYGFDEAIFDQFLWLLANFEQFNTVRGVTLAGHHASLAFLLLVPLVHIGGGPNLWNVLHAVAVAGTAVPLFLLARDKLGRQWPALLVGLVWLAQPTAQWLVWEGFHPEGMALPFLVATFVFGERMVRQRRACAVPGVIPNRAYVNGTWLAFGVCFLLTITWKEDLALALGGMGAAWVLRRQWRLGLAVGAAAAAWFVVLGMWAVPHFAGGTVYSGIYGELGRTPGEIVARSVTDPALLGERLQENDALGYARQVTETWAFVPLLSPSTLLIGLPQWFTNVISAASFTFDPRLHYTAVPLAALGISFVEALRKAWGWRREVGILLLAAGLVASLVGTRTVGPSPVGARFDAGTWPLEDSERVIARREAIELIPDGAGVSTDYRITSHLSQRDVVYEFPNPWRSWNYGVAPGEVGDPADVEWVVVDTLGLDEENRALVASLLASGEMAVRFSRQEILVLERIAAPGGGATPVAAPGARGGPMVAAGDG